MIPPSIQSFLFFYQIFSRGMSFIQLKEFKVQEVIERKERINLIVKCSISSHFVFFKDRTFQHIDRETASVLYQGKLDFLPSNYLQSTKQNRIVVTGYSDANCFMCAVIDTQGDYSIETREIQNVKPEVSTKYHLYEADEEGESHIYLIRVLVNIENALALAVFDLWRNIWCQQMIALPSKFLNYTVVNTSINDDAYKEPLDLTCHSFALIAPGEKFDSLNYSKVKFCHERSEGEMVLKVKFIITRELKLKRSFVVVGGYQCEKDRLLVVGNSRKDSLNPQEFDHGPAFTIVNTATLENNDPQELTLTPIDFHLQNCKELLLRNVIGILDNSIIVLLLSNHSKKISFARLTPTRQELFFSTDYSKSCSFSLSVRQDCIYKYELECENFFEKIKKAPSKIRYNLIKIYDKQAHYKHLLKCGLPSLDEYFINEILNLF